MMRSELFWEVFRNTLLFVIMAVPLSVIGSLALALLVNNSLRGITFFRTAYFLPVVSSMIAVALVWSWIFNPEYGLLNYLLLEVFGIRGPAGLQNIPQHLYEAATVDGAGSWRKFLHVTLPMLSPTTFFILIITLINAFQVFEQTYVMTRGGPANATLTLSYYVYQNAFQFFQMGNAAALSYILFAIVFAVTLIQFRAQRRWVFYG
jgi:multiple sugar transport system permease protein